MLVGQLAVVGRVVLNWLVKTTRVDMGGWVSSSYYFGIW